MDTKRVVANIVKTTNEWIQNNSDRLYWVEQNIASFIVGQCKQLNTVSEFGSYRNLKFIKPRYLRVHIDDSKALLSGVILTLQEGTIYANPAERLNTLFKDEVAKYHSGDQKLDTPLTRIQQYVEHVASVVNVKLTAIEAVKSDLGVHPKSTNETLSDTPLSIDIHKLESFTFN